MRSELFHRLPRSQLSDWSQYCVRGLVRVAIGAVLIGVAWAMAHSRAEQNLAIKSMELWFETTCLLTGLSLIVHFGLFNLVAGMWRFLGVKYLALFRAPLLSESLSDFWGYRWNRAFSEMTALCFVHYVSKARKTGSHHLWQRSEPFCSQGYSTSSPLVFRYKPGSDCQCCISRSKQLA